MSGIILPSLGLFFLKKPGLLNKCHLSLANNSEGSLEAGAASDIGRVLAHPGCLLGTLIFLGQCGKVFLVSLVESPEVLLGRKS